MEKQEKLFIAVFADGGLISVVRTGTSLRALVLYMQHACNDERFDPETDDARIFDELGEEVFVLPSPGELEEHGQGVYLCPKCADKTERISLPNQPTCLVCDTPLERLDTIQTFYTGYTKDKVFVMEEQQIPAFIMAHKNEDLLIVDDMDRLRVSTVAGPYLNRVNGEKLHQLLIERLVMPLQYGETDFPAFEPISESKRGGIYSDF